LELGEGFRDFPFILFQSSFYLFIFFEIFDAMTCNDGKQKHDVEKDSIKIWWMEGREIKIKYENGGRRAENKI
jgi:hypothetical protein